MFLNINGKYCFIGKKSFFFFCHTAWLYHRSNVGVLTNLCNGSQIQYEINQTEVDGSVSLQLKFFLIAKRVKMCQALT